MTPADSQFIERLTPRVLELVEAIRRGEPSSTNETARVVDRDAKNVLEELGRLAQLGIMANDAFLRYKNHCCRASTLRSGWDRRVARTCSAASAAALARSSSERSAMDVIGFDYFRNGKYFVDGQMPV
jgi:predicted transcriptional regulator